MEAAENLEVTMPAEVLILPAQPLWKAQQCVSKDDSRKYLTCILLEPEGETMGITGTDGHMLYHSVADVNENSTKDTPEPLTIRFLGKIPKTAKEARLLFSEPGYCAAEFYNKKLDKIAVVAFEINTELKEPVDWRKVIPTTPLEAQERMAFNLGLMDVARKVLPEGVFEFYGPLAPVIVRDGCSLFHDEFMVLMPMRID